LLDGLERIEALAVFRSRGGAGGALHFVKDRKRRVEPRFGVLIDSEKDGEVIIAIAVEVLSLGGQTERIRDRGA
jgi:hypothetical protein